MSKIIVPSGGPDAWRQFLAKPDLHWAIGYSARTMANAWESADGMPSEIAGALAAALGHVEAVVIIPEHKTALPGGRRDSQSDALLVARHATGLVVCTIEGKVDEPFGPTVGDWLKDASGGKLERLAFICELLDIDTCPPDVHYQLLHRTAAAVLEAERFAAQDAAMLVHSWSPERRWHSEFERFVAMFNGETRGTAMTVKLRSGKRLLLDWVTGDQRFRAM